MIGNRKNKCPICRIKFVELPPVQNYEELIQNLEYGDEYAEYGEEEEESEEEPWNQEDELAPEHYDTLVPWEQILD